MTDRKVNIIDFLNRIDAGDLDYYTTLTDEEKKSISLVVVGRWLSCTKNLKQIVSYNALVNPFMYKFAGKHNELLYNLMVTASSGTKKNYRWVGRKKRENTKPVSCKVISQYYGISTSAASGYVGQTFKLADILKCADDLGYDDAEQKKIKDEFKNEK